LKITVEGECRILHNIILVGVDANKVLDKAAHVCIKQFYQGCEGIFITYTRLL
jgi:hypothetical protein